MSVDERWVRNEHLGKTVDNIDQGDNVDSASELFIIGLGLIESPRYGHLNGREQDAFLIRTAYFYHLR